MQNSLAEFFLNTVFNRKDNPNKIHQKSKYKMKKYQTNQDNFILKGVNSWQNTNQMLLQFQHHW